MSSGGRATSNNSKTTTFSARENTRRAADKASDLFDQAFKTRPTSSFTTTSTSTTSPAIQPQVPESDADRDLLLSAAGGSPPTDPYHHAVAGSSPSASSTSDHSPLGSPPKTKSVPKTKKSSSSGNKFTEIRAAAGDNSDSGGEDQLPIQIADPADPSTGLTQDMDDVDLRSPPSVSPSSSTGQFAKPMPPPRQSPKRPSDATAAAASGNADKRPKTANIPAPSYKHNWQLDDKADDFDEDFGPEEPDSGPRKPVATGSAAAAGGGGAPVRKPIYAREPARKSQPIGVVKDAHHCHDDGQKQHFQEDVEYFLETLSPDSPHNMRCLSLLNLCKKCLVPDFRQFIRSQGYTLRIFRLVEDAWKQPSLALMTACVFYVLSRAKVSIAINENTLFLLVQLLRADAPPPTDAGYAEYNRNRTQVWSTLDQWSSNMRKSASALSAPDQQVTFSFDVTKANISTGFLALESLVYISARKHEPWFKKCIRNYGGLEFLAVSLARLVDSIPSNAGRWDAAAAAEPMKLLERYLRILEAVTLHSDENRAVLITHKESLLLKRCARLLSVCHDQIDGAQPTAGADAQAMAKWIETMKLVIRVLCNLSNNNELCCERLGKLDGFLRCCMHCITHIAETCVPAHERFDLLVLLLGFVCNIVEHSQTNRQRLLQLQVPWVDYANDKHTTTNNLPVIAALAKMFVMHDVAARRMDEEVDEEIDLDRVGTPTPDNSGSEAEEDEDNENLTGRLAGKADKPPAKPERQMTEQDIQQALQSIMGKAGAHMEDCMSASYVALLIGCLLQQNEEAVDVVREHVPDGSLKPMLAQLNQFHEFMEMTSKVAEHNLDSISRVIDLLRSFDKD